MNRYLKYMGADVLAFVLTVLLYTQPRVLFYTWLRQGVGLEQELSCMLLTPYLFICLALAYGLAHAALTRRLFPQHRYGYWKVGLLPLLLCLVLLVDDIYFWYQLKNSTDIAYLSHWEDIHFMLEPLFILLNLVGQILLSIAWLRRDSRTISTVTPVAPAP